MIDNYQFGHIIIDSKSYNYDIWIDLSGKVNKWQRKGSHVIGKEDVEMAVEKERPEILIIGTGAYGAAKVLDEAKKFLASQNIEVMIKMTGEAAESYNKFKKENKKVAVLLHLTC